ncbi:hypothetical protein [Brevundimonas sp.]|uniref:hypothetical protein n=1 Tax=Brevundimonas sp. TaxID=1871086 RepID=UPI002FDA9E0B
MTDLNVGRARVGLCLLGAGVVLAACSTASPPQRPITTTGGAPAPVEGYDWFLNEDGAATQLVYGLHESDDVRLTLACERADGRLEVSAHGPTGGPAEIHLESGGETERLHAKAEALEISDGDWLTAAARTSDPVFQRFRRVGWIALWQGGERHAYAPHADSAGRIEQFFGRCG